MSSYAERLVRRWEAEDRKNPPQFPKREPRKYTTPQSTIDAFWYLVQCNDEQYLANWLLDHPMDAVFLTNLRQAKAVDQPSEAAE